MFFFKSHMSTQRDTSRDSNGLQIIGAVVGCVALGPFGALGLWAAGPVSYTHLTLPTILLV